MRNIASSGIAIFVTVTLAVAGCGGDDDDTGAGDVTEAPSDEAAPDTSASATDDTDGGAADIPQIAGTNFPTGRVHVEVSGDLSDAFEADGSGSATGGYLAANFPDNAGRNVSITAGAGEPSGLAITTEELSTAGDFASTCDITFTQNDASGVAAEFTCTDLEALDADSNVHTISVTGNFTLTA